MKIAKSNEAKAKVQTNPKENVNPKVTAKKGKSTVRPILDINQQVEEYSLVSAKSKLLDDRKKYLANEIKDHAIKEGIEDSKGSKYCHNNKFVFGANARNSVNVNTAKAEIFLKGAKLYTKASTVVPAKRVLDLDKLAALVDSEQVSMKDFENMCDKKTTFAVYVKELDDVKEEEMPEIIQIVLKKRRA